MTKTDFEAIAEAINSCKPTREPAAAGFDEGYLYGRTVALADVVDVLVERFTESNPRFNEERFREACGIE